MDDSTKKSSLQPSREELIAHAADLVPVLRERAIKTEELRRIPDETIADLKDAGLWRILKPECYGGYITDFGAMVAVSYTHLTLPTIYSV